MNEENLLKLNLDDFVKSHISLRLHFNRFRNLTLFVANAHFENGPTRNLLTK